MTEKVKQENNNIIKVKCLKAFCDFGRKYNCSMEYTFDLSKKGVEAFIKERVSKKFFIELN